MDSLAHAMTKARRKISRDKKGMAHRRGEYHCVGTGLSLGGGSKVRVPSPLSPLCLGFT